MSTETHTFDAVQPTSALPPVPLTDAHLTPLLDQDVVEAVYVPDDRPEAVHTLAGRHEGDILEFYVETIDAFVKFRYDMAPGGLAWHRCEPWPKTDRDVEAVYMDLEDYHRLEVSG